MVAVLALGTAASSAMFATYDAWLLRPLPFAQPARVIVIVGLLVMTSVLASYVPASRAAGLDPATSLRAN